MINNFLEETDNKGESFSEEVVFGSEFQNTVEYSLEDFAFQVYVEIELFENEHKPGIKLYTGVKYSYELDDVLNFPLKIKDLPILARLGIQIYSMEADDTEKTIASTVIDLFDSHKRLRQGTWNLQLHMNKSIDRTFACNTPGLTNHASTV